jgi:T-complex protein 1 subunit eta
MKLLDIVHPAAQTLVDIARSQDEQVGDGTTSVVVLAGEFLHQSKEFVEENVAPNLIIRGFRTACNLARAKIEELAVKVDTHDPAKFREMLELFAGTSMNSKLIAGAKQFFAKVRVFFFFFCLFIVYCLLMVLLVRWWSMQCCIWMPTATVR